MHVLSFDFQSDVTSCGRHIRFFNVIDEYTRTALAIIPSRSFKATDVVAVLENIIAETGVEPTYVRCDNGPEFTAGALIDWCAAAGVKTAFIDPGSPWQNGFIESFNAQFRREQLAGEIMDTMAEAEYFPVPLRGHAGQGTVGTLMIVDSLPFLGLAADETRTVIVETDQPPGCPTCGVIAVRVKERRYQRLRDIPVAGPVEVVWSKYLHGWR